ncbi:hypothetical protein Tco_0545398 [Tanacetum coccineum]
MFGFESHGQDIRRLRGAVDGPAKMMIVGPKSGRLHELVVVRLSTVYDHGVCSRKAQVALLPLRTHPHLLAVGVVICEAMGDGTVRDAGEIGKETNDHLGDAGVKAGANDRGSISMSR